MPKHPKVIIGKGNPVTLKDYIASGGEASVYKHQNMACKIYHDPTKCIPEQKILELQAIKTKNIMAPRDIIFDPKRKTPIGFAMPFMSNTEYLVRIFSKGFKKNNNIKPENIVELVKNMREQLIELHKEKIVVGDYNEMNTLTDKKTYTIPYGIDVDSYQTRTFPCTAIMDSVRDRTIPFGTFKETSDWFSWAVVTFQLYAGIHPYKGKHPNYKVSELGRRMEDCTSVFNSDVKIPKVCSDFSIIPKPHLEWYKKVFEKKERSAPPLADGTFYGSYKPIIVTNAAGLVIDLVHNYQDNIKALYYFGGDRYVVTDKAIYNGTTEVFKFIQKPKEVLLAYLSFDGDIVVATKNDINMIGFFDTQRNEIGRISGEEFMACNDSIYTMANGELIENHFTKLGKIKHIASPIASVVDSSKMFTGMVIQDIFGKTKLTIPYEHKKCANVDVPEIDGWRIIDAKRIKNVGIIIGEHKGVFKRCMLWFDAGFTSYDIHVDDNISYRSVNLMVKQNGMAVTIKDHDTMEMFYDLVKGSKEIKNSPIELDMTLHDGISQVLFINDSKLQSVRTK